MKPEEYRRIALSLPGVVQSSHHDHPDFRVGGKIFATVWRGNGVLILTPEQQSTLVRAHPKAFSPVTGGWGKKGSTTVHLDAADESLVRRWLKIAWQNRTKV